MLHTLRLKNFTAFESAAFEFCPGLNVIKSQLLKLGYALASVSYAQRDAPRKSKEELQRAIADKLLATLGGRHKPGQPVNSIYSERIAAELSSPQRRRGHRGNAEKSSWKSLKFLCAFFASSAPLR